MSSKTVVKTSGGISAITIICILFAIFVNVKPDMFITWPHWLCNLATGFGHAILFCILAPICIGFAITLVIILITIIVGVVIGLVYKIIHR